MNLMLFKYGLPLFIGYVLFVGIAGQLWPLKKPRLLPQRPSWLLGLWAGASVTFTLMLGLNMAYHLPSGSVQALIWPSVSLLAALVLPGLAVYFWYRNWVSVELLAQHRQANAVHHARAELKHHRETHGLQQELQQDPPQDHKAQRDDQMSQQLDAAEALVEEEDQLMEDEHSAAPIVTDAAQSDYDKAFYQAFNETQAALAPSPVAADQLESETQSEETRIAETQIVETRAQQTQDDVSNDISVSESDDEQQPAELDTLELQVHPIAAAMSNVSVPATNANDATAVAAQQHAHDELLAQARAQEEFETELLAREEAIRAAMNDALQEQLKFKADEFDRDLAESKKIAETEASLRNETEEHLRVTRKAMIKLESKLQTLEASRADEMIELEADLEKKIRLMSKAEATADREQQQRATLESELTKSRQELLEVRTETRKNTAARAKALASANKAVAFARQAITARAKTESELSGMKDRVLTQQTTISSLIKALETEKSRHREEMAGFKAEFAQKESELEIARLNQHNNSEAANQPLTTRLVKKVAKARPVV